MSNDQDRVAVPTNGRRPHAVTIEPNPTDAAFVEPETGIPTQAEIARAMSPRGLAIGFGVLASVGLLVAGLLRRRAGR